MLGLKGVFRLAPCTFRNHMVLVHPSFYMGQVLGSAFTEPFIAVYSTETSCSGVTLVCVCVWGGVLPCTLKPCHVMQVTPWQRSCLIFYEVGSALSKGENTQNKTVMILCRFCFCFYLPVRTFSDVTRPRHQHKQAEARCGASSVTRSSANVTKQPLSCKSHITAYRCKTIRLTT